MRRIKSKYLKSKFNRLAKRISQERDNLYNVGFFHRPAILSQSCQELHIMRRWNSFTPLTSQKMNSIGGAYLLLWRGRGTVIDPGYGFMNLYAQRHSILDLHCVIVTHDHPDHCDDLFKILTLLREVNERRALRGLDPHRLALFLSYGVYFRSSVLLQNKEIAPYLDVVKVLPPFKMDAANKFGFRFKATLCQHRELLGDHTSFGVRLELPGRSNPFVLSITSDTGYRSDIVAQYESSDLLSVHIGSMEEPHSKGLLKSHLGTLGVIELLRSLRNPPHIVLITEWGEEFYGQRVAVCDLIKSQLPGQVILPADMLMRLRLPDCQISSWPEGEYVSPTEIVPHDDGSTIFYYKKP